MYTLKGDRHQEYGYVKANLPSGSGLILDVGCGPQAPMCQLAIHRGYTAIGVDLRQVEWRHPSLVAMATDLMGLEFSTPFAWVINVSAIEHFGLAGRYGVNVDCPDKDLEAMAHIRSMMDADSRMLLTIPVGPDIVRAPLHRIYGPERLPKLLSGYEILNEKFWSKFNSIDNYVTTTRLRALETESQGDPPFMALGAFTLRLAQ